MEYQIRISKAGKNCLTATDPRDFIFHSAYNTFKIIATGTGNWSLTTNPFEVQPKTIAHGLGYAPFVIAFALFPDGYISTVGSWQRNNNNTWFAKLRVDDTYIYFDFANMEAGNPEMTVKYYIVEVPT